VLINFTEGIISISIGTILALTVRFLLRNKYPKLGQALFLWIAILTSSVFYNNFTPLITQSVLGQLAQWHKFTSAEGKFEVFLPSTPIQTYANGNTKLRETTKATFVSLSSDLVYSVAFQHHYNSPLINQSLEEFLLEKQEAAVNYMGGNLISESDLLIEGIYPAKEFYVESTKGNPHVRIRIFLANESLYTVSVGSYEEILFSQNAEKFFSSFKLLK
jgi:hypothetical protein